MWNVFEYPFAGAAAAGVLMIVLLVFGAVCPDRRRRWHPLVPVCVVILSFAVCLLVQTDREKIFSTVKKGTGGFETQRIEPIKEIIADDYSDPANPSAEYLFAYCQVLFQTSKMKKITLYSRQIEMDGSKAEFTTNALIKFAADSDPARMGKEFLLVKIKLYLRKTTDKTQSSHRFSSTRWLIYGSQILEVDKKPINWNMIKGM